jgi:hypothetical protein
MQSDVQRLGEPSSGREERPPLRKIPARARGAIVSKGVRFRRIAAVIGPGGPDTRTQWKFRGPTRKKARANHTPLELATPERRSI